MISKPPPFVLSFVEGWTDSLATVCLSMLFLCRHMGAAEGFGAVAHERHRPGERNSETCNSVTRFANFRRGTQCRRAAKEEKGTAANE